MWKQKNLNSKNYQQVRSMILTSKELDTHDRKTVLRCTYCGGIIAKLNSSEEVKGRSWISHQMSSPIGSLDGQCHTLEAAGFPALPWLLP